MRVSRRLILVLGLALAGLSWAVRRGAFRGSIVGPTSTDGTDPAAIDSAAEPETARGWRLVAVTAAICVILAASILGWKVEGDRSEMVRTAVAMTSGDPSQAPTLLVRFGCGGCHTIPGVPGADGKVGPDLADLRERVYVGGVLWNSSDNLIGWIVDPQRFSPHSAMPATGITEAEARDVAAYLYAQ